MQLENRELPAHVWAAEGRGYLRLDGNEEDSSVPGTIDLRPLLSHPAAAHMLMLARGQLNRAFRAHGLLTPDSMLVADTFRVDPAELDDPAAKGVDHARARHGDAFVAWTEEMPSKLARPVVEVLRQTLCQLPNGNGEAIAAVTTVCDFLLRHLR